MKVSLGTMTVGGQVPKEEAQKFVDTYLKHCPNGVLDSANLYQQGKTDEILGQIVPLERKFEIHSKIHPWDPKDFTKWHPEGLKPHRINEQMDGIISAYQGHPVDCVYLHAPDPQTPIKDSLTAVMSILEKGQARKWGVSNYPAWRVAEILHVAENLGMAAPSYYQGMYSVVARGADAELLPCLQEFGIPFVAYNVLAGGIFSGKHTATSASENPPVGRFTHFKPYTQRFWKDDVLAVKTQVEGLCKENNLGLMETTMRWTLNHSPLAQQWGKEENRIIVGASSCQQLEDTMKIVSAALEAPKLPDVLLDVLNTTQTQWPKYFRP